MIILHTSDWHIGRSFYGRKRYGEFFSFLDWLAQKIEEKKVYTLPVACDVFTRGPDGFEAPDEDGDELTVS